MTFDRIAPLTLLLASQGVVAPAHAELAWPDLCARLDGAGEREPDAIRRYRMRLNDEAAGLEAFRFWRNGEQIRVVVQTELEGNILMFPADFRHCRDEWWSEEAGGPQLVRLEGATSYAVPFKPDYEITSSAILHAARSSIAARPVSAPSRSAIPPTPVRCRRGRSARSTTIGS